MVARDEARLQALAERLHHDSGVVAEVLRADLLHRVDLMQVEQRLRDDASITMLVNNAGIAGSGPFASADPDKVEAIIGLNVLAVTRLAVAATRNFIARGSGTIVNIASVTALMPESFEPVYLATKAFVLALSQSMQQELGPKGIHVQAVLPGVTRTEIWERSGMDVQALPPEMVMEATELVDAALAGLDMGETVTIPSLPDMADWENFNDTRRRLQPLLSRRHAAERYRLATN
jgi:short-subunit dehydrogenase